MPPDQHPRRLRSWTGDCRGAIRATWGRLPLRTRLVAGFAAAMLLVLTAAGAFVYLRVQYALDLRLNEDLAAQSTQLAALARTGALQQDATAAVPTGSYYQLLDTANHVLAQSPGLPDTSLLSTDELTRALRTPLHQDRGALLPISARPLRLTTIALAPGATPPAGQPAVLVVAVRRDQRDEALRELIGQLTIANLVALAIASLVGYRLARAALVPVERYRTQAARIANGDIGVRLSVPDASHDEIARLGRTLNDMLGALETALATERRFVNDASHELRTPLTLLATELELALRRPRSAAELEQTVRAAAADTAQLIALANTLLTVGVHTPPHPEGPDVNLSELVTGLVERYRAASEVGPEFRTDIDPATTLRVDAARISQLLVNLLDNATRHGRGPVTVTLHRTDSVVVLAVHDTGTGMDPAFLPHATERFSRADTARTSPGTGLGLALVETIVRAHDGELRICSAGVHHRVNRRFDVTCAHPAAGTTATVLLPDAATPDHATPLT